jgi:hypothetical protein
MDETDGIFALVIAAILLVIGISEFRREEKPHNIGLLCLLTGGLALVLGFWAVM